MIRPLHRSVQRAFLFLPQEKEQNMKTENMKKIVKARKRNDKVLSYRYNEEERTDVYACTGNLTEYPQLECERAGPV